MTLVEKKKTAVYNWKAQLFSFIQTQSTRSEQSRAPRCIVMSIELATIPCPLALLCDLKSPELAQNRLKVA